MLKLILRMPRDMDATLLMHSALALAHYRSKYYYKFRDVEYGLPEYGDMYLPSYEPDYALHSATPAGVVEYEVLGYMLDLYLMETLAELQKLIPFEMYFEQRGKYDPNACSNLELGEIYDSALGATCSMLKRRCA
ncbi:MAG: hypothetical protein IJG33_17260 [Selenomonadaceae bacterium]|nr:hypothetical protein [Selenomonadaceae bacterium]